MTSTFRKTAVFRLHNPTRRKSAALDRALRQYNFAVSKTLETLRAEVGPETTRAEKAARAWRIVQPLPLGQAAKIGAQWDALRLLEADAAGIGREGYHGALSDLAASTTLEAEAQAWRDVAAGGRHPDVRPMVFPASGKKGFLLLRDTMSDRYALWLNLHPKNSRHAQPVELDGWADVRTGKIVRMRSRTGCLFPLAFGAGFQERRFIARGKPMWAALVKSGAATYDCHITFAFEAEPITPRTVLGLQRSRTRGVSVSVADMAAGAEIFRGELGDGPDTGAWPLDRLHALANEIVSIAGAHAAQVVTSAPRVYFDVHEHALLAQDFRKLWTLVDYRLTEHGLPRSLHLRTDQSAVTCLHCGGRNRANRAKGRFTCVTCGMADDAELHAARMLTLKQLWRMALPAGVKTLPAAERRPEHSFEHYLRERAERRPDGLVTSEGHDLGQG